MKFGASPTPRRRTLRTAKKAPAEAGDTWTWTAIEADTKLIVSWLVGGRDSDYAMAFMDDLRGRLANRVQLTSDGHRAYLEAVEGAFGADVDYAMIDKIYGTSPESAKGRYSPAECIGVKKERIEGDPDWNARQHVLRRAAEPFDADAHAPVHPADECLLQEVREPRSHGRALHGVL